MEQATQKLTGKEANKLVVALEKPFANLPHLPKGLVDFLVAITPWLALLGGIFGLIGGLSSLTSIGRVGGMWGGIYRWAGLSPAYFIVSGVVSLLMGGLLLMAFKPLKDKKLRGWMFLFWVEVLSVVQSLVVAAFWTRGWVGTVIGALIGFYVLFEVKKSYK